MIGRDRNWQGSLKAMPMTAWETILGQRHGGNGREFEKTLQERRIESESAVITGSEARAVTSIKKQLLDVVSSLPDDCTMDDFRCRLYVRQCIDEGVRAIDEGRVYTHDEMREIVKSWRKSSGPSQPATT
jgi:hypothetical protein